MPEEIRELGKVMRVTSSQVIGRREYRTGSIDASSHEVVTVFSRWGKVAAASTATTLIDRFGCELLIFTGVAGAASAEVQLGDIVIADRLVQHDVDASGTGYFKRFEIPLLDEQIFDVDASLVDAATSAAKDFAQSLPSPEISAALLESFGLSVPQVHRGLIASGDQFINREEYVAELSDLLGPIACVEMEGAAVAQVAFEHGVPLIVIRSISDRADGNAHLDFPRFVADLASHYSAGIVTRLLAAL